jgi:hypothetical protein
MILSSLPTKHPALNDSEPPVIMLNCTFNPLAGAVYSAEVRDTPPPVAKWMRCFRAFSVN